MTVSKTFISWTDSSWNPIRGCSTKSDGCRNCYAMAQAGRFSGPGQPYEGLVRKTSQGYKWTGEVRLIEKDLEAPLRWRKPRRIFVNSMSDLFHESVPDEWIDTIYAVMLCSDAVEQGHVFQILTKRPERMHAYFADYPWPRVSDIAKSRWNWHMGAGSKWYPGNVWLGVSVENQGTADERIPWLLKTPAAVRFVSYEPALGPVNFDCINFGTSHHTDIHTSLYAGDRYPGDGSAQPMRGAARLDQIITGGESGPKARPCHIAWLRSVRAQCNAAGVACFVKQLGSNPWPDNRGVWPEKGRVILRDRKGADIEECPLDLRVQQMPR